MFANSNIFVSAVQILEHIYDQLHPLVDPENLENKLKKRKVVIESPKKTLEPGESSAVIENHQKLNRSIDCTVSENEIDMYRKSSHCIAVNELNCNYENCIFPSKGKSKVKMKNILIKIRTHYL